VKQGKKKTCLHDHAVSTFEHLTSFSKTWCSGTTPVPQA